MQLTIQQKVFSLREAFAIMDGEGNKLYEVKGKILSIGHKLTVSDLDENPVMHIHQKVLSLVPKYFLEPEGGEEVELKGHITLLKPHYTLELPGGDWEIRGDFTAHEYEITCGDRLVAAVVGRVTDVDAEGRLLRADRERRRGRHAGAGRDAGDRLRRRRHPPRRGRHHRPRGPELIRL